MEINTTNNELASQVKNAFSFIQKLYNESSYLIKEIEGQLGENDQRFQLIRPSGYSISARSSTGLEPNNVNLWLLRKFAVAFVEESNTELKNGQTFTEIDKNLKVLYFRIILDDKNNKGPQLFYGVFYEIEKQKVDGRVKKFENLMGHFEYNDNKLFSKLPKIEYEDSVIKLRGKFEKINLLEINSSEELMRKIIEPSLKIYNGTK